MWRRDRKARGCNGLLGGFDPRAMGTAPACGGEHGEPPFPFSGSSSRKPAVGLFAQLYLLHLPRTRHGQLFDEDDVAGDFVACDLAAAVVDDLRRGELVRGFDAEEGDGDFAETRVRKAYHRGGSNGWMARKVGLDFQRVDIFSTDLEHVLIAPHEAQVPVGSDEAHVAGVEPAVGVDRFGGFLGLAIIGLHDHVAAHENLAGGSWRLLVACRRLDNLDFIAGRGITRSLSALLLAGIKRAQCYACSELAHAIAREEPTEHLARLARDGHRA